MSFECWWGHTSVSNGLYEGCITSDKERDLQESQHWSLADCVDNCMPYLDLLLLYWLGFFKSSEIGRLRQYWSTINRLLRWCSGFLPSLITNFHLNDARWWRITKVLMSLFICVQDKASTCLGYFEGLMLEDVRVVILTCVRT